MSKLYIADKIFESRLFLGTSKFNSYELMGEAIAASKTQMVTVSMKRLDPDKPHKDSMMKYVRKPGLQLLPNTSGVRNAKEAVFAAELARSAFETNWIKLEIHPDPTYLLPDPIETYNATVELVQKGFVVLPYTIADPLLCKRLEEAGAACVMPMAAPIGTSKGVSNKDLLRMVVETCNIPVIVDAGLGAPSHAAEVMEMGVDAVLVNTAIARSGNPVEMAKAFSMAVESGRMAYLAELTEQRDIADSGSPLTSYRL
ncbi:Thiazole synthase [Bacteroides coprosuis DSM 18011]|uniref:Thiazole synthase n=1 Tax=Bacteroides coprosuis DSM 18011 TaxID=679937 RepID=F3ZQ56_9BACE|nr:MULTISPECIES: thiazole synthase [Bacteroides]EGJ71722.1 Thiazole synthase [Bacteroides coprosuis DSM 18011]HJD91470.1 thiazole synthase [Bacteroides coprosuis]